MGDELLDLIDVPDMETPEDLKGKVKAEEDIIEDLDMPGGDKEPAEPRVEEKEEKPKRDEEDEIEYSKTVQKRINKLTGRAKAAEERAAAAEAAMEVMRREQEEKNQQTTDEKLLALTERRKAAIEDGDLESVANISDEIYELRLEKRQAPPPPQRQPEPPPGRHASAEAWIERNSWYTESGNDDRKRQAEKIQDELLAEGMNLSDELYSELDERLAAWERKAQSPTGSRPGHLSAPSDPGIPANPPAKKGGLTPYDIKTMRQFKLDPNNPQHRASYLKRRSK